MKKTFFAALALLLLISCSEKTPHAGWTYDTVVYEMTCASTPRMGLSLRHRLSFHV